MQCTYFTRDGHCSKGQYCPFLHDTSAVRSICKNYLNGKGCRFGSSCAFLHSATSTSSVTDRTTFTAAHGSKANGATVRTESISLPLSAPVPTDDIESNKLKNIKIVTSTAPALDNGWVQLSNLRITEELKAVKDPPKSSSSSSWNFEDSAEGDSSSSGDGVYFYGASGSTCFNNSDEISRRDPTWHVKNRDGPGMIFSSSDQTANSLYNSQHSEQKKSVSLQNNKDILCPFFSNGDCKFGSKCRYSHDDSAEDNDYKGIYDENNVNISGMENAKENGYRNIIDDNDINECSICISKPDKFKNELYGIMSHCNCVFCLHCIREWRNEGIKVSYKSDQVRMCPNCRIKSHYVIPSLHYVHGQRKEDLISRYKQSLSVTPCKVSTE